MDGWGEQLVTPLKFGTNLMNYSDPNFSQIVAGKKALQLAIESGDEDDDKSIIEIFLAACDGDLVTLENGLRNHSEVVNKLYPTEERGVTLLIYAICFDNYELVETLLNHNADPDLPDTLVCKYTPIMWAVYFNQLEITKLLLNHQADPFKSSNDKDAIAVLNPENLEMYEYFKSHNLLNKLTNEDDSQIFHSRDFNPNDGELDNLDNELKLQTITINDLPPETDNNNQDKDFSDTESNAEYVLAHDHVLLQEKEFDYEKVLPDEYIKFNDADIPALLDYIFNLRINNVKFQHNSKVAAAIIFQLIRYSHLKVQSEELTLFLFDCFIARLRSVTNTKSGVFNMIIQDEPSSVGGAGDIVLLSYWLSVIQFLHFYFCKNDIYKQHPQFLQELINIIQSLVSTLSFSINSRLNRLADECLLDFTNLVDVSNVLYAKDWNLFKSRKISNNTFDDIHNMLYPPSQEELMKPSPLKYIQTLGALDYVLNLHKINNLIKFQCFSQVFYYINAILFNKIISQSKYCSRIKAIQIRLNISTIEDWLRSHNYKTFKPDHIGGLSELVNDFKLTNLLDSKELKPKDPSKLLFYYNSIYHIGKIQLQPTIELLQYLQCMSLLRDEENFINTINQFEFLNYYQILKIIKNYKYEVDEEKLPKPIVNLVKRLISEQGEKQVERIKLNYMTQNKLLLKEYNIYINPNYIYPVALPNLTELINSYGAGLGGIKVLRGKKYQPSLPMTIMDDLDELLNRNQEFNDTYDYEQQQEEPENQNIKGDEMFKEVQMPSSLLHKNWGKDEEEDDFESNPW